MSMISPSEEETLIYPTYNFNVFYIENEELKQYVLTTENNYIPNGTRILTITAVRYPKSNEDIGSPNDIIKGYKIIKRYKWRLKDIKYPFDVYVATDNGTKEEEKAVLDMIEEYYKKKKIEVLNDLYFCPATQFYLK